MRRVFGVLTLVVALLLAGCARGNPPPVQTPTPGTTSAAPPTSSAAPAPTSPPSTATIAPATLSATAPAAQTSPQNVLRVGLTDFGVETHDPYSASNASMQQMGMIYDWLVGVAPDGQSVGPVGGLADKWENTTDGLTWTFHLRKGIRWDKGYGEVTSDDVKFSLQRNIFAQGSVAPNSAYLKAIITDIQTPDPYTVVIQCKVPGITLLWDLSRLGAVEGIIMPKKAFEELGDKNFANNPVGSGPYRLVKHEPGLYFQYETRNDYWGGTKRYKVVYLYKVPQEATRIAMLKQGELDIAEIPISSTKELQAGGFKLLEKPGTDDLEILFHRMTTGVLSDRKVRLALNLAVNKQEMLDTLFESKGKVLGGAMPSWALGSKDLAPYPYDLKRAKELLTEAGYPNGFDLEILAVNKYPVPLIAQALSGYYTAIGIRTKITPMEYGAWVTRYLHAETPNSISPFDTANKIFWLSQWKNQWDTHGSQSPPQMSDPQFDALIAEAEKSKTADELAAYQGKIQQYLYDNADIGYLLELGGWYAINPKVNMEGWNGGGKAPYQMGLWQLLGLK